MSVALHRPMTLDEFLAWEERQELRWECDGTHPIAMTGSTLTHDRINSNLKSALDRRLSDPCEAYGPNVKVLIENRLRYPDAVITCAPQDPRSQVMNRPVVVFEIVRDGNARTDRIEKVREYLEVVSILRYVILEQTSIGSTVFVRHGDVSNAETLLVGEPIAVPEAGIEFPLDECYARLDMPRHAPARGRNVNRNGRSSSGRHVGMAR